MTANTPTIDAAAASRRIGLVTFIGGLGGGLVFPILPALGLQLGIAGGMIGLILSANRITRMAFDPVAGRLVDRLGGKGPLALGLVIECIGILGYSAGLHLGTPAWWFLGGRALFGVGSALLLVGAQASVLGLSGDADRGRLTATVRIAMGLGLPGGLVLGGLIADRASDDTAFLVGAALTLLGALAALRLVPSAAHRPHRHHGRQGLPLRQLPGFPVLVSAWGFNLLIFLSVQGVLLATLVVLVHQRGLHLLGMADQGTGGLVMAAMMACSSLTALTLGRWLDRLALRSSVLLPALVVLATGFALLGLAHDLRLLLLGAILVGVSFNGVNLPMLVLLGDATGAQQYGRAVGAYQLFGDVGGSIGPIAGLEVGLHFGLLPTYLAVGALVLASIPAAVWINRRERSRTGDR
ncbi:MAG: MFS transporter [Gammaproteobacteria bacterium]